MTSPSRCIYFLIHPSEQQLIKDIAEYFDDNVVGVNGDFLRFDALVTVTGTHWIDPIGSTCDLGDDNKIYFTEQHEKIETPKHIVLIGGGFKNTELTVSCWISTVAVQERAEEYHHFPLL
jgi:pyruvate/2-oxoglutarate dehydrogenase complex dihydrolipoamide dehydrogenase (E3) component